MPRYVEIPWLRVVPRRLGLVDASGRRHDVSWLDIGDPQRESLPARTRQELDALESRFTPATWGRYSWRVLIAFSALVLFAAAVVIPIGAYAMFPPRAIFRLLAFIIGTFPFIVLVLIIAGRLWARRTGAAARISACLAGGRCPACLAEIDSLSTRPVQTVLCACHASWPTLGALQAGGRPIRAQVVVTRTIDFGWLALCFICSATLALSIRILPLNNQIFGAAAGVVVLLIFAPFITRGRPAAALRLGLAVAVPPLAVMLWILFSNRHINLQLLIGGVAAFGACLAVRIAPRSDSLPGWDVAHFVCASCGYDLRGTSKSLKGAAKPDAPVETCPECGAPVQAPPTRE